MDFLNKAFAQLTDLFRSMTPGARITSGLLLVVVVISLGYLFQHQVSGPDVFLMNGEPIPPSYLPAMEAAFAKANLNSYSIEGARIRVPRGQQASFMAALADSKALPPNFGSALREAQNSGNVFESPKQREQRIKTALQEELSLIIRSMKGIESAYVLYDTETKPGLSREKLVTASVSVKPLGSEQLEESQVSSIRHLVAGSIAGLKAENVTVADLNGRVFHGDPQGGGFGSENLYIAVKNMYERDLKTKILGSLANIPSLTVEASVVLDREKSSRSMSIKNEPKTVTVRVSEKTTTRSKESGGAAGRPGYPAQVNGPITLGSVGAGKGPREEEEGSTREEENRVSSVQEEKENVGLTPKLAKVSVGIPSSYFEKVWRERNPVKEGESPKTPETTALDQIRDEISINIRKHVAGLLPPVEGTTDTSELVTITTFQDIKPGEIPVPPMGQKVIVWLGQYWSTLGIGGLALVSLFMLRSMVRGVPAPESATMSLRVSSPEPESKEEDPVEAVVARRLHRFSGTGPSLRDELSEMVKEDPDSAANILRTWIGQVG